MFGGKTSLSLYLICVSL